MRIQYLDFWENTPLAIEGEETFSVYICIFDNSTDEVGRVRYDVYSIAKLNFVDGAIDSWLVMKDGLYAFPQFKGWTKNRFILWLEEEEKIPPHSGNGGDRINHKIYKSIVVLD